MHLRWVITIKSFFFLSTKTKSILEVRKNGQQNVAKQVARFCCPFVGTFRNLENFCLWNPESGKKLESGILGFGILNLSEKKSEIPITTGIQNPSSTDKSGIHSVEARIQDCLGFPYAGRDQ